MIFGGLCKGGKQTIITAASFNGADRPVACDVGPVDFHALRGGAA